MLKRVVLKGEFDIINGVFRELLDRAEVEMAEGTFWPARIKGPGYEGTCELGYEENTLLCMLEFKDEAVKEAMRFFWPDIHVFNVDLGAKHVDGLHITYDTAKMYARYYKVPGDAFFKPEYIHMEFEGPANFELVKAMLDEAVVVGKVGGELKLRFRDHGMNYAMDCVLTLFEGRRHELTCTPAEMPEGVPRTSAKVFDGNPAPGEVLVEVRGPKEKLRELKAEVLRGEGPILSEILEPIRLLGKVTNVSPPALCPEGEAQLVVQFSSEKYLDGYPLEVRRHEGGG